MASEEMMSCDGIDFETQTDVITLLDNVKCQTNNSSQRHAFVALASILSLGDECQNYFREAGGLEEIKGQLIDDGYAQSIIPVALFCLACAVKDNATSKAAMLSNDLLSAIHQIFVSIPNRECLQSAAFFLACLVSNSVKGQQLASKTGCVEDLVVILRDLTKDECMDENHWMTMTNSITACINNPQNENNQRISSCMIPHMLKVVTDWSDESIVQHSLTLMGQVVHKNVSNQKLFKSCGGIDILSSLISEVVEKIGESKDDQPRYLDVLKSVIATLDIAVAEHEQNVTYAVQQGLVPKILSLFQQDKIWSGDMRLPLQVLAHFMEYADQCCDTTTVSMCQQLMVKFFTESECSEDDELRQLIKYILSLCIGHGNTKSPGQRVDRNLNRLKNVQYKTDVEKPRRVFNCFQVNEVPRGDQFARMSNPSSYYNNKDQENMPLFNFWDGKKRLYNEKQTAAKNCVEMIPDSELRYAFLNKFQNKEVFNQNKNGSGEICGRFNDNHNGPGFLGSSSVHEPPIGNSLNEVDKFIGGLNNGETEAPAKMLTLMALQEKQIQMFSEVQKLISTALPYQIGSSQKFDEITSASQQHPKENQRLSPTKSIPHLSRLSSVGPSVTKTHQNEIGDCGENSTGYDQSCLQNVSHISSAKSKKDQARHSDDKQDKRSHKAYNTPNLNKTVRSKSSFNILSPCNTNYLEEDYQGTERSFVKDTSKTMKIIRKTHMSTQKNNGGGIVEYDGNGCDNDDNHTNMSGSTIDFTISLHSDLERALNTPCDTSTPKYKRSLSCMAKDKSLVCKQHCRKLSKTNSKDDSSYLDTLAKLAPIENVSNTSQRNESLAKKQFFNDDNNQIKSKTHPTPCNVRKVKSIPSIELSRQASVSHSTHSYHRSLVNVPKFNEGSDLNESFQNAIKALSIPGKENGGSVKNPIFHKPADGSKSTEMVLTMEDMDSGFGPGLEHDNDIKTKSNHWKRERLCSSYKQKGKRNVNPHSSKIESISECGISDQKGAFVINNQKDFMSISKPCFSTPQPLPTFINKQMHSASRQGVIGDLAKPASSETKVLNKEDDKEGMREEKFTTSKGYRHNKGIDAVPLRSQSVPKIIKENVYTFPSGSETVVYPSTPESDVSIRSLRHNLRKRFSHSNDKHISRRSRVLYSDQEILNLRHGVATLGTRWQQIVAIYQFHPSRTAVDLKEKFKRLMEPSRQKDKNKQKIKALPFSSDETKRLVRGVRMFGHNWKAILAGEKFLPGRTHQDLRDKWRTLSRTLFNRSY